MLGVEARGFIFAAPVAYHLEAGFVPVRKAGKLPWEIEREEYALEYGTDLLEIHRDAISEGARVLIVDDVLATGGTASATARLVERLGGVVVGIRRSWSIWPSWAVGPSSTATTWSPCSTTPDPILPAHPLPKSVHVCTSAGAKVHDLAGRAPGRAGVGHR